MTATNATVNDCCPNCRSFRDHTLVMFDGTETVLCDECRCRFPNTAHRDRIDPPGATPPVAGVAKVTAYRWVPAERLATVARSTRGATLRWGVSPDPQPAATSGRVPHPSPRRESLGRSR
jgi:hypothetical protein